MIFILFFITASLQVPPVNGKQRECGVSLEPNPLDLLASRIVNGNLEDEISVYPWMVRLAVTYFSGSLNQRHQRPQRTSRGAEFMSACGTVGKTSAIKKYTHYSIQCGGALITQSIFVTAGHCLVSEYFNPVYTAFYGHSNVYHQRSAEVSHVRAHRDCALIGWDRAIGDLALVFLTQSITMTPICLPTAVDLKLSPEDELLSLGWGNTVDDVKRVVSSAVLKKARMLLYDWRTCRMEHSYADLTGQMCALPKDGVPGPGDSGGPLMAFLNGRWVLLGVTSWSNETRLWTAPFVFTNVTFYMTWIRKMIPLNRNYFDVHKNNQNMVFK